MRVFSLSIAFTVLSCPFVFSAVDATEAQPTPSAPQQVVASTPFRPFTGKVLKDRVRLRLHASLDAPIFQEMGKGDLLVVTGESEDFYSVKPPSHTPAFVFRTYILDDVVEGSHVNVRLQPDIDSPVIAQLNSGDEVHGQICPNQTKWLEIDAPESVRFFVYKDYVDNIGDEKVFARIEKRKEEVNRLLETAYREAEQQLKKSFEELDLQLAQARLEKVVHDYNDFPDQVAEAKKELSRLQERFLEKKVAFLEGESSSSKNLVYRNKQLSSEMLAKQERIQLLEQELRRKEGSGDAIATTAESFVAEADFVMSHPAHSLSTKMAHWIPVEERILAEWLSENLDESKEGFMLEQQESSITLTGILEGYDRPIRNKPGDHVLINPETRLPICFLYSTKVDLDDLQGKKVTLEANERPNHHFAYPAYHVLALD